MLNTTALMTRTQAAEYCRSKGFPVAAASLAKYAVVGGGPDFTKFGRKPLYPQDSVDAWIEGRLSKRVGSTSELEAA